MVNLQLKCISNWRKLNNFFYLEISLLLSKSFVDPIHVTGN